MTGKKRGKGKGRGREKGKSRGRVFKSFKEMPVWNEAMNLAEKSQ